MEWILIGLIVVVAIGTVFVVYNMDEQSKWDLAANALQFDGYSDDQIVFMLGPRPKDAQ